MDPTVSIILALAVGVALGALICWLYASRGSAAATERAARATELQKLLDAVTGERDEALQAKAALQADARNFDARMADLQKSREELVNQFREIGDKLLEKAASKKPVARKLSLDDGRKLAYKLIDNWHKEK